MSPQQERTADAIADPSRQYKTPLDVLGDPQLDVDAKRAILESWKKDAELLSTATNENIAAGWGCNKQRNLVGSGRHEKRPSSTNSC